MTARQDSGSGLGTPGIAATVVMACSMLGAVMQTLDSTIANVALPYMQGSMAASQDEINWVLTSYIVAAAIMTAPVGFLTARFGRTRVYIVSVLGFTLASILCGASQSLSQIVLCRIVQGMCGAALVPLAQSVLFDLYPMERRGPAMAVWSVGVQLGPIAGPILGGWLTAHYSWRWVFYVNVPFGILTALGLLLFLKESPRSDKVRLDWIGFAALSIAIGAFQLLLDRGEEKDWFSSPEIIVEACVAGLAFYIFLAQFALAKAPFLPPRLFADRNFLVGIVFIFIVGVILYATLALQAPYLQELMDYPVLTAGYALAPRGFGTILAAILCGRLIAPLGPRLLIICGFIASMYSLYEMMQWTPAVSEWRIVMVGMIQGFGLGAIFVPLAVVAFATLDPSFRTQGASVFSLVRNLGSSIGISITGAMLERNTQVNHAEIAANITPFDANLRSGAAAVLWNPATHAGAVALNQEITRQASIIGYIDDYKLMLLVTLVASPLVLVIREARRRVVARPPEPLPE